MKIIGMIPARGGSTRFSNKPLALICGKPMVKKFGRFGEFIACSGYPDCKNTKPIVHKIGVPCPVCGKECTTDIYWGVAY